MRLGRRGVLRLGVGLVPLVGGCAGAVPETERGPRTTEPPTATDRRTATRRATETQTARTETETETATESPTETDADGTESGSVDEEESSDRENAVTETRAPNAALAERTANVVGEIVWFVREYPDAIDRFQAAMTDIEEKASDLAEESELSLPRVRELQATVAENVATVEDALAPHFGIHNLIGERTSGHTGTAIRFARRGDFDRVREELRRLAEYAAGFTTEIFRKESLPRQPITNVLVRMLRKGEYVPETPFVFQVRHLASGFSSYAYETHPESPGPYDLDVPAVSDRDADGVLGTYAPFRVARGRREEVLVSFTEGDAGANPVFGTTAPPVGPNRTVYVQQYRSERAAENAATLAFARVGLDQFREDPTVIGDSTWERVYYRAGGDVQYAYLTRAGRHLLATGVTTTAWEERVDWDRVHERTWLGGR